ncbi:hypothetical protein GIB67_029383 [Kingdonia uniflora]|uniref:GDSL esterase/lipase n=1 Tax=Kingdonia uniflora TaxID=39325 RepID=A0A7J7NXP7_9MAGN|nr:hypothetical protein GIB67_029383 [Kingdonia uniflora]
MELQKMVVLLLFLHLIFTGFEIVESSAHRHHHHHHHHHNAQSKFFVFGDSYADTGNNRRLASSWKMPYGITFPGKPAGRFSDGRVLTDYLASYVGVKSPVPYRWRKRGNKPTGCGMNFAFGGTGVFDTLTPEPNMTTQIDFLQKLIRDGVYTKHDLSLSIALVSNAGNDYGTYNHHNGTAQGFPAYITSVVNQLTLNLKRIHRLGVRKIAVTTLQPLGCLPQSTFISSYQSCNVSQNLLVSFHNLLLQQGVERLNNSSKDSAFVLLDINSAFTAAFKGQHNLTFSNPLKPCCVGISNQYSCGSVDETGVKKYVVCEDPKSAFFWDTVHPSQQGWLSVYSALQPSLNQLYS